jgi:hypothetical protein
MLARAYNSLGTFPGIQVGKNWLLNFDKSVRLDSYGYAHIYRQDGRTYLFSPSGGGFVAGSANRDIADRLTELKDMNGIRIGWRYDVATGACPEFCVNGPLAGSCRRLVWRHNEHQETRRT